MEEITHQMFQNLEDEIDSHWDRVTEECNYLIYFLKKILDYSTVFPDLVLQIKKQNMKKEIMNFIYKQ